MFYSNYDDMPLKKNDKTTLQALAIVSVKFKSGETSERRSDILT